MRQGGRRGAPVMKVLRLRLQTSCAADCRRRAAYNRAANPIPTSPAVVFLTGLAIGRSAGRLQRPWAARGSLAGCCRT